MKNKLLFIFLIVFLQAKAQVEVLSPSVINEAIPESFICYNNSSSMIGNTTDDRYFTFFNDDTLFLNVNQNGTWTRKIAHLGNNISLATIALQQDTIWLCWKEAAYIKSMFTKDKGDTWSSVMNVSPLGGNVSAPSISAASNGKIHFVWFNEGASDTTVLHNVYSNGAFLSSPNILSSVGFKATWPSVTSKGDSVFCTWKESHTQSIIYFAKSFSGGNTGTWSSPASTNGATTGKDPNLSYSFDSSSSTHYLYLVYDGNQKIYLQKSTDFGVNWSTAEIISNTSKRSQFAKVESNSSGFVGISWEHRTVVSLFDDTKKDVGFAYSTSFGATGSFSHDSLAYTYNPFGSTLSMINKIDENNYYLVWKSNDTVNNKAIFYERRISVEGENSLKTEKMNSFSFYPNPCNTHLTVSNKENSVFEITIFDVSGKKVFHEKNCVQNKQIDVSLLKKGIYLLQFSDTEKHHKLIVN